MYASQWALNSEVHRSTFQFDCWCLSPMSFSIVLWVRLFFCFIPFQWRTAQYFKPQIVSIVRIINNCFEWLSFKPALVALSAAYVRSHHKCCFCSNGQRLGNFRMVNRIGILKWKNIECFDQIELSNAVYYNLSQLFSRAHTILLTKLPLERTHGHMTPCDPLENHIHSHTHTFWIKQKRPSNNEMHFALNSFQFSGNFIENAEWWLCEW